MWPLKKSGLNNPLQVKINNKAQKLIDYWNGSAPKPSTAVAFEGLMQLAEDTRNINNIVHHDVADAMIRQVNNVAIVPFKPNIIEPNAILFADDYDIGRSGIAYHDKDSAEYWVSTTKRTPWNTGSQYRNDGVDIERCYDAISNGYDVGWIETGEWMQYSIYVPADVVFDVNVRYASKDKPGKLRLLLNDEFASENNLLPQTGGTQNWQTNTIKAVKLFKGWNRLRVLATEGGFNLNYLEFVSIHNTAMTQ
jgi:hypothetical protein